MIKEDLCEVPNVKSALPFERFSSQKVFDGEIGNSWGSHSEIGSDKRAEIGKKKENETCGNTVLKARPKLRHHAWHVLSCDTVLLFLKIN